MVALIKRRPLHDIVYVSYMMWSTVELRELRVFLTLAAELHFRRTAEQLHLTPSRVSQTLRDLERKMGHALVQRTSRRVELTEFGERFRLEAGHAYDELSRALERLSNACQNQPGPLRLGLFSDPGVSRVPRIVRQYETTHPGCVVEAAEVPVEDPFGQLHRGEIDIIASWLPHGQPGLIVGPILSSEPRVLAVGVDHPLAQRSEVSLEDVSDYPVMRFEKMPKEFHEEWIPSKTPSGRRIRHMRFSDRSVGDRGRMTSELLYLVATGGVVHPTVPSFANMFGHPDIVYVPIIDMPPMRSALVWRHDATHPQLAALVRIAECVVSDAADGREPRPATTDTSSSLAVSCTR